MVGLINLFVYILKYPTLLSAQGDVAALDVAVGHFGHLEVLTSSELSFPFAREAARIAYTTVKSCGGRESLGLTRPATPRAQGDQQGLSAMAFLPMDTDIDNNVAFSADVSSAVSFILQLLIWSRCRPITDSTSRRLTLRISTSSGMMFSRLKGI